MPAKPLKPLIVAHRGSSAYAPENTLAAFRRAIDEGADGIEFDVRLAGDGVPVVFHDHDLIRVGNLALNVASLTSGELAKIDVGSWFNRKYPELSEERFSGETVPTLEALLNYLKGYGGRLYIELKCGDREIHELVRAVGETIRQSGAARQVVVKSFRLEAVALTKEHFPEISTASLFAPKILNVIGKRKHLLTKTVEVSADEISIHYSLATRHLVKRALNRGIGTAIWTADHPRWVKRALKLGINVIITNDPARLLKRRRNVLLSGS